MRLLLVEDDAQLGRATQAGLTEAGFVVDWVRDGAAADAALSTEDFAAVVLDLGLPRRSGLEVLAHLRAGGKQTPVLILTARDAIEDRVKGLDTGADDYVVKPFALREVEARLLALTRRAAGRSVSRPLQVADLRFDPGTRRVTRGERVIELGPIPLKILEMLMQRSPRVVWRRDIEQAVWGDSPPDSDVLRSHMHVLRSAVDKPSERPLLRTLRGVGYQLTDPDALSP